MQIRTNKLTTTPWGFALLSRMLLLTLVHREDSRQASLAISKRVSSPGQNRPLRPFQHDKQCFYTNLTAKHFPLRPVTTPTTVGSQLYKGQ